MKYEKVNINKIGEDCGSLFALIFLFAGGISGSFLVLKFELVSTSLFCLYFCMAILWGVFATNMNSKFHPSADTFKHAFCMFFNTLFCPFAMMLAIYKIVSGEHDKYFTTQRQS